MLITEAEKFHDVSTGQRTKDATGVIQSESEGIRTRWADA